MEIEAIEVRVRKAASEDWRDRAVRLCDWPAARLVELIQILRVWGIDGESVDGEISGHFALDREAAYFEILIHEGSE